MRRKVFFLYLEARFLVALVNKVSNNVKEIPAGYFCGTLSKRFFNHHNRGRQSGLPGRYANFSNVGFVHWLYFLHSFPLLTSRSPGRGLKQRVMETCYITLFSLNST